MAGDDFTDNNAVNDPLNQYRAIFGVPSRRRIIFGATFVLFVLTLIVIAFALLSNQRNFKNVNTPYALFHSTLDVSVDPCVNFYNFTCGLWEQSNVVDEYSLRVTAFSLLQEKIDRHKKAIFQSAKPSEDFPRVVNSAIHFYNKCVQQNNTNANDINLILQFFDQFGGWPILNELKWNESAFDLLHYSAFLIKKLDVHSIFGVYSTDSNYNDGKNVIYLKSSTLLDDEDFSNEFSFFTMINAILHSLNNSNVKETIYEEITILRETAIKWRKLLIFQRKVSDVTLMSIQQLSLLIPEFDWLNYLQLVTNDTLLHINETLTMHDLITIEDLDYLKKVVNVINSDIFSKRELSNLFGYFTVKNIWILIPGVLKNYAFFNKDGYEDMMRAATSKCYDLVFEIFSCSVDYIYVKNSSHAGIQDNKILVNFLKVAFNDIIQRTIWLDEISKVSVLHRINYMNKIIGFPDYLNNKTKFDETYKDFPVIHDYRMTCYLQAVQFYIKLRNLPLKITINQTKDILPRPVSDVSAYYIVHQNSLVYPISMHNPPFYYFEGPSYLNFGSIGSVIGHEMMHAVDCTGIQGNDLNVSWFTDESRTLYKEHASCFKKQYSIYDSSGTYKNNGTRTLRENIADTEGLHLAFEAYKKHEKSVRPNHKYMTLNEYTPDQMFFIAFGTVWCSKIEQSVKELISQIHSLPDVRVNNAVSNSKAFAAAFNCPKGSPMNPTEKCLIW